MNISLETTLISIAGILVVAVIVLGARLWRMERRLRAIFEGKDAKNLEDVFALLRKEVMEARRSLQSLDERVTEARGKLRGSVQNVGIVRLNPFRDAGGDQSFCIALLDETRTGVVVSSLYARDGVRVYGKPVVAGVSTYTLSAEEKQAIEQALREV